MNGIKVPSFTIPLPTGGKREDTDEKALDLKMRLRHVNGQFTITDSEVTAWFRFNPLSFAYKSLAAQNNLIRQVTIAYAGLRGHDFHMRVTNRPYPAAKWAVRHAAMSNPLNPAQFADLLTTVQGTMKSSTLSENETYIGVVVGGRNTVARLSARTRGGGKPTQRELSKLGAKIASITSSLGRSGADAVPVTQDELEWLTHRSVGLHLPEPFDLRTATGSVSTFDVPRYYNGVTPHYSPGKPYVRLVGSPFRNGSSHADGEGVTRYIAVVSIGRTEDIEVPERHDPWMAAAEQLPFAVEWSVRGRFRGGREAAKLMTGRIKLINDQFDQLRAHHKEPDANLARTAIRAKAVEDEMRYSTDIDGTRMHGFIRAALSGRTPEELAGRVTRFTEQYRDMNFDVEFDVLGQESLFKEFWPSEKVEITSHKRHQPLAYFAAALPQMAATVGDRQGTYLGYTVSTSRRAVMWDMHRAMIELEKSGMTPVVGAPGSGKSSLLEFLMVRAAERRIYSTAIDHSGPMARICYLPRFKGVAKHIDLLSAEPGTLSVYASIPDPNRDQLREDPRYQEAVSEEATKAQLADLMEDLYGKGMKDAALLRRQAATSTLRSLMPHTMRKDRDVIQAINNATRFVSDEKFAGRSRYASLDDSVQYMLRNGAAAEVKDIGKQLKDMSNYPQTRLFFGNNFADLTTNNDDYLLVVMTAAGLTIPTGEDESDWSDEERIAIPLLTAANQYAAQRIYSRPMAEPKVFAGDEVHVDRRHAAGRALWNRLARDSRKWRTRVLAGTQLASDLLDLEAAGLTSEVFTGRMEDEKDASAALKLMRVPTDAGYEAEILNLSTDRKAEYRDFLFADADGNVDKIRLDFRYDTELVDMLKVDQTKARADRVRLVKESVPA